MKEEERPAVHTVMLLDMVVEEKKDDEVTQVGWGKGSSFVFLFSVHTIFYMLDIIIVEQLFTCQFVEDPCVHIFAPSFCTCIWASINVWEWSHTFAAFLFRFFYTVSRHPELPCAAAFQVLDPCIRLILATRSRRSLLGSEWRTSRTWHSGHSSTGVTPQWTAHNEPYTLTRAVICNSVWIMMAYTLNGLKTECRGVIGTSPSVHTLNLGQVSNVRVRMFWDTAATHCRTFRRSIHLMRTAMRSMFLSVPVTHTLR